MSRFSIRILIGLAIVIVAPIVSVTAHEAAPSDEAGEERILTPDEALRLQAEQYAADFNVSVEEAEWRLNLQPFIGELAAQLEENEGAVFAELRAENGPEFRIVVQVVEGGESRVQQYIEAGPLEDLVTVEVVRWTLRELQAFQEEVHAAVSDLEIQMDTGIRNQQVRVYVTDAALLEERLRAAGRVLPEAAVVHEVAGLAIPSSHGTGSLMGGLDTGSCTSGFAGKRNSSGAKGIHTAAHCSDSQSHAGHALSPVYNLSNANSDIQWHTNSSGESLRNLVRVKGSTELIAITGLYWHANNGVPGAPVIYVGQQVCISGSVLGYKCGVVFEKYFDPGGPNPYANWQRNAMFVRLRDNDPLMLLGDSGAPVVGATGAQHNSAFGINSGTMDPDSVTGDHFAFFTPIDPIYAQNYSIFVNCPNNYC